MSIMTLAQAQDLGYCIISRRFLQAARIDRADWLEHMNSKNAGKFRRGTLAASQYRRCHTQDRIAVPSLWIGQLPNSDDPKAPAEFKGTTK